MSQDKHRRNFIKIVLIGTINMYFLKAFGGPSTKSPMTSELSAFVIGNKSQNPGNFHSVFKDPILKEEFFLFLKNVYNIYPEKEFHSLISRLVEQNKTDEEIYQRILTDLDTIKPFASELTYALPALAKQKKELSEETMEFLKNRKSINGYLEIGTPGRYISELKKLIPISGDIALVNITEPSFSPLDIVERGQLFKNARYIPLNDYAPIAAEESSFEVVTNYIGFHHSSLENLSSFVTSVHKIIKPGGSLILRDHDVLNEKMNSMVSLAHDVFNAGLYATWEANHSEIRNFRSIDQWIAYLKDHGFEFKGRKLLQPGDPTQNTLMEFIKT